MTPVRAPGSGNVAFVCHISSPTRVLRRVNHKVVTTLRLLSQPSVQNLSLALFEPTIYSASNKLTVPPLVASGNQRPIKLRTSFSFHDSAPQMIFGGVEYDSQS